MVVAVGFEPTFFQFQDFRLRVFRCLSLHIAIQRLPNEIKRFIASLCKQRQEILCKICAIPQVVQKVCKLPNAATNCARFVQTEGGVILAVFIPWRRPLALYYALAACPLRTVKGAKHDPGVLSGHSAHCAIRLVQCPRAICPPFPNN